MEMTAAFAASRSLFLPAPASNTSRCVCRLLPRDSRCGRRRTYPYVMVAASLSAEGSSNYVVPLDLKSPCGGLARPIAEILRDLNKRVPDNIIDPDTNSIPWYHANRMLSFYAPGWCGEIRDLIYRDDGSVTVLYRVTIRGSDGEAHRESSGTVALNDVWFEDPVAAAEEIAFGRASARFGFGLYLYHKDEML